MPHVDPDMAIDRMRELWRGYGNEISEPLLATWRKMCDALNKMDTTISPSGWTVLAMPTGIGKTQFAALYSALLPNPTLNLDNLRSTSLHPGLIFITRLMSEAIAFAALVNKLADRKIAAAYCTASATELHDVKNFPVLAITHAGWQRHQSEIGTDEGSNSVWEELMTWHCGQRSKVIIDETPNFVKSVCIDTKQLAQTLGALAWLRDANKGLYSGMQQLLSTITDPASGSRRRRITDAEFQHIHSIDVELMLQHLRSVEDNAITVDQGEARTSLRATCKTTAQAIRELQKNDWGWISYQGRTAQIHSANLRPSVRDGSGVILDATADLHPGYKLLSPPARIIAAANNVRSYSNVTLHVAWGQISGKDALAESAGRLWREYRSAIECAVSANDRILVCCHELFEQKVRDDLANSPRITFEHYGNIDGRNDWKDYEALALIGLFHLPTSAHLNTVQALLGPQTDYWLQNAQARKVEHHDDVLAAIQRGSLAINAIQTVTRVRCRRMVDRHGGCDPTDIFLPLPADADGRAVYGAILEFLPGVQVMAWQLNAGERKKRTGNGVTKLFKFFADAPGRSYTKADVRAGAKMSAASLDRAIRLVNERSSNEYNQLSVLGVTYHAGGGMGVQSYFVKA